MVNATINSTSVNPRCSCSEHQQLPSLRVAQQVFGTGYAHPAGTVAVTLFPGLVQWCR